MFMLATVSVPSNITIHWKVKETKEMVRELDLIHFKDDILDSVETNKFQNCVSKISINCARFMVIMIVATKEMC